MLDLTARLEVKVRKTKFKKGEIRKCIKYKEIRCPHQDARLASQAVA